MKQRIAPEGFDNTVNQVTMNRASLVSKGDDILNENIQDIECINDSSNNDLHTINLNSPKQVSKLDQTFSRLATLKHTTEAAILDAKETLHSRIIEEEINMTSQQKANVVGPKILVAANITGKAIGAGVSAMQLGNTVITPLHPVNVSLVGAKVAESAYDILSDDNKVKVDNIRLKGKAAIKESVTIISDVGTAAWLGAEIGKHEFDEQIKHIQQLALEQVSPDVKLAIEKQKQWVLEKKDQAKATALEVSTPVLEHTLNIVGNKLKNEVTTNPLMFSFVKKWLNAAIDAVWSDIKVELMYTLQGSVLKKSPVHHGEPISWYRIDKYIRAQILYHYFPYDKDIWNKIRDPGYWLIFALTLVPIDMVRVSFFMLVFICIVTPGPPDHFQLINFILKFKGSQFISGGVFASVLGAIKYLLCVQIYSGRCGELGPGVEDSMMKDFVFYAIVMLMVWIAFFMLPYSTKQGEWCLTNQERYETNEKESLQRLKSLLFWDIAACAISLAIALGTCKISYECSITNFYSENSVKNWQFKSSLYWAKVFYSFCSFPFFLLKFPPLVRIFTHARPSGYNKNGKCIPLDICHEKQDLNQP